MPRLSASSRVCFPRSPAKGLTWPTNKCVDSATVTAVQILNESLHIQGHVLNRYARTSCPARLSQVRRCSPGESLIAAAMVRASQLRVRAGSAHAFFCQYTSISIASSMRRSRSEMFPWPRNIIASLHLRPSPRTKICKVACRFASEADGSATCTRSAPRGAKTRHPVLLNFGSRRGRGAKCAGF
eukprot:COSAG06_NODE_6059_length_3131_cov_3.507256_3_plen_185_part_00